MLLNHIDKTVKKANSTLGFLRRNLKVSNQDTKTTAYKTLVRPTIEYCSSVWSPHTKDAINSVSHSRSPSMEVTLLVFQLRFVTYLAALRWTISILFMASFVCGLHTDEQYSIVDKHSFFPQTTSIWNTLPAPVAEAPCLVSFKQELSTTSI
jgi:hypothetical protein